VTGFGELLVAARAAGRPVYGGWVTTPSPYVVEAYARAGFDYVGIDCQHSVLDEAVAATVIRSMPAVPFLARASANRREAIGRLLDAGAIGVIVPGIDTADEAEQAVAACRYPPRGVRSFGPFAAGFDGDHEQFGDAAMCFPMIETSSGLANLDAICAVPGVSGIYVGPSDLSLALGRLTHSRFDPAELVEPMNRIKVACAEHGIVFGAHAKEPAVVAQWVELGVEFMSVGGDIALLNEAAGRLGAELQLPAPR
jgi:4-hydroxy-2-oxoheptanedioate aldolase